VRRPVLLQRWAELVFLHWRYEPAVVQRLLPAGVTVDTYDGSALVGLVPFRMEDLGLSGLGTLPVVGRFPEVNVRTYLRAGPRRGVWFFSLDVDRSLVVATARSTFSLQYCFGRVHHDRIGDVVTTSVHRRWPRPPVAGPATTTIAVRTGGLVDPQADRERFLTSRWGLVSATRSGRLRYAPVDHAVWPLHEAAVLHLDDRLVGAAGLPAPDGTPLAHWSPGLGVRIGRPVRVASSGRPTPT
jgi:uncharacterized protein